MAYVYPGWHSSAYRPAVDEWDLLDTFHPCFAGHQPPARPLAGRYDDSTPEVSAAHEREALEAGIEAFTYFTYYDPIEGFVMADPMRLMLARGRGAAATTGLPSLGVAATWCVRLPHETFPVAPGDGLDIPPSVPRGTELRDRPIASLTLDDLEELVGADSPLWSRRFEVGPADATTRRWSPSVDASPTLGDIET